MDNLPPETWSSENWPSDNLPPDILTLVQRAIHPQRLSTLQETILSECWEGRRYPEIAESLGYDAIYVRYVGSLIWQQLSAAFGEKVAKSNVRAILNQRLKQQSLSMEQTGGVHVPDSQVAGAQAAGPASAVVSSPMTSPAAMETMKEGSQSYGGVCQSTLYVDRPPIESRCYQAVQQQGALIRIKAPRQMGKTSLLNQILHSARQSHMQTVTVSLRLANSDIFLDLDRFLQWFCAIVSDQLGFPYDLTDHWKPVFGSNYNCTHYFSQVLLPQLSGAVVIALDDVDILFQYPAIAPDFLRLLRAWCEKAKHSHVQADQTETPPGHSPLSSNWYKMRLIVIHSSEVYISLNQHQSPFNIGLSIELPDFMPEQVMELAQGYALEWFPEDVSALMALVGGKPILIQLALEWISSQPVNLETVLSEALTARGIYSEHLRQQFRLIQKYPELLPLLKQIMTQPEPVTCQPLPAFQLESLGLVKLNNLAASPSCELYRQYLGNLLKDSD